MAEQKEDSMISIKPTTIGSLVLRLPYCSRGEAAGAGFKEERAEGHNDSIIQESEFDEFLIKLLEARKKVKERLA